MAGRPRRTRIYGANYNIGESYYKPTLDNLNRKQFGGFTDDTRGLGLEIPNRDINSELIQPKSIFKKALTEEPSLLDYRSRLATQNSSLIDDELDDNVQAALRKIREVKKANSSFLDDTGSSFDNSNRKRGLEVGRLLKSFYDSDDNDVAGSSITKFTKNFTNEENMQSTSSASLRAHATRERLANIESDISERFEKQVQRDKRSANLKKLLSESDYGNNKAVKKVTF